MFNIVFPAFETEENDTSCTFINIIDDDALEGDMQMFSVDVYNIDPSNVIYNGIAANVIIEDNDGKNCKAVWKFQGAPKI